jgi:hypothetical protein
MYKKLLCIGLVVSPSVVLARNTPLQQGGSTGARYIPQQFLSQIQMQAPTRAQVMPEEDNALPKHNIGCVALTQSWVPVRGGMGALQRGAEWMQVWERGGPTCRCVSEEEARAEEERARQERRRWGWES